MKHGTVATLLFLGACTRVIEVEDYDRSCATPDDCEVIFVGDPCSCSCDVGAINAGDYQQYLDDRGDPSCSKLCGACPPVTLTCEANVCGIAP